ncbi:hypothetical protein [Streptomyces roseolilacinus]|uniref:Uncharacterized protein n=1 Tax=Streptomyces roseolilacinus TaxID=66904 RepID=A0A918B1C5_9ACTN|nr:hypothetical protein [Streptomyces roseolilacinus]GGQ11078.1 hypothetical protein GCM10010249_31980 [Streptomyces roseolilacinus]
MEHPSAFLTAQETDPAVGRYAVAGPDGGGAVAPAERKRGPRDRCVVRAQGPGPDRPPALRTAAGPDAPQSR